LHGKIYKIIKGRRYPALTAQIKKTLPYLFFCIGIVSLMALVIPAVEAQPKTDLEQKTVQAFDAYTHNFERNINAAVSGEREFLWIDSQDSNIKNQAHKGEILIFKPDKNIDVPKGIIHVWGVSAFIAGTGAGEVIDLLLNYDRHKDVYPSVIDSKLLEKNGNNVKGFLKFKYKKVITVVLNTEHQAELIPLDKGRYFIRVHSTRVAQVENYGKPDEAELPVGRGGGFMWRLNTYWFVEPQPGGVFLECQSLTLTRSIPFGLGWIVGPFVKSIPKDSLKELVDGTRRYFPE
jgi:hypothetical protein